MNVYSDVISSLSSVLAQLVGWTANASAIVLALS